MQLNKKTSMKRLTNAVQFLHRQRHAPFGDVHTAKTIVGILKRELNPLLALVGLSAFQIVLGKQRRVSSYRSFVQINLRS